jgi:hypothetical protein
MTAAAHSEEWETTSSEEAACILLPCFDAVRDIFSEYQPRHGPQLEKLSKTRLLVDDSVRDSPRHYAACRADGMQIIVAPQAADLPLATLAAILGHEFGHAADFAYPAHWRMQSGRYEAAVWKPPRGNRAPDKVRLWADRSDDQVEWSADAIAYAVIGQRVEYCGPCMVQCFDGGRSRPRGLR